MFLTVSWAELSEEQAIISINGRSTAFGGGPIRGNTTPVEYTQTRIDAVTATPTRRTAEMTGETARRVKR